MLGQKRRSIYADTMEKRGIFEYLARERTLSKIKYESYHPLGFQTLYFSNLKSVTRSYLSTTIILTIWQPLKRAPHVRMFGGIGMNYFTHIDLA